MDHQLWGCPDRWLRTEEDTAKLPRGILGLALKVSPWAPAFLCSHIISTTCCPHTPVAPAKPNDLLSPGHTLGLGWGCVSAWVPPPALNASISSCPVRPGYLSSCLAPSWTHAVTGSACLVSLLDCEFLV